MTASRGPPLPLPEDPADTGRQPTLPGISACPARSGCELPAVTPGDASDSVPLCRNPLSSGPFISSLPVTYASRNAAAGVCTLMSSGRSIRPCSCPRSDVCHLAPLPLKPLARLLVSDRVGETWLFQSVRRRAHVVCGRPGSAERLRAFRGRVVLRAAAGLSLSARPLPKASGLSRFGAVERSRPSVGLRTPAQHGARASFPLFVPMGERRRCVRPRLVLAQPWCRCVSRKRALAVRGDACTEHLFKPFPMCWLRGRLRIVFLLHSGFTPVVRHRNTFSQSAACLVLVFSVPLKDQWMRPS